jgi:hypothetical protein
MGPEMLSQVIDALRQKRNLDLRRSGIGLARPVLVDDPFFDFLG